MAVASRAMPQNTRRAFERGARVCPCCASGKALRIQCDCPGLSAKSGDSRGAGAARCCGATTITVIVVVTAKLKCFRTGSVENVQTGLVGALFRIAYVGLHASIEAQHYALLFIPALFAVHHERQTEAVANRVFGEGQQDDNVLHAIGLEQLPLLLVRPFDGLQPGATFCHFDLVVQTRIVQTNIGPGVHFGQVAEIEVLVLPSIDVYRNSDASGSACDVF